jgi:hypothetical protein
VKRRKLLLSTKNREAWTLFSVKLGCSDPLQARWLTPALRVPSGTASRPHHFSLLPSKDQNGGSIKNGAARRPGFRMIFAG